jgi:hypothetical protein
MRGINLTILLFLLVSICHVTYASAWNTYTENCNNYSYIYDTSYMYVQFWDISGKAALNISPNPPYPMFWVPMGVQVSNDGFAAIIFNGGVGSGGYLNQSWSSCTTGYNGCKYIVQFHTKLDGTFNASDGWVSDATNFPLFKGCVLPEVKMVNSYPSMVMTDRYRFNFTVNNTVGWGTINCILSLYGTVSSYAVNFTSSTVKDVLYSNFPKQLTTGNVLCTYLNGVLYDNSFLVDTNIPYEITTPILDPPSLYPFDTLNAILFSIQSQYDQTPYPSPVKVVLSSDDDIAALNCSGSTNITRYYSNQNLYYFYPLITCNNPASIQFTITTYDQASQQTLASKTFNASWGLGNMVIDNINLIKRPSSGNLELWATLSSDYYHKPIPDIAYLTCNYTLTSYDTSTSFNGTMEEYRTYGDTWNGTELTQTDMRNVTVDIATSYNLSNKFRVTINCSADQYNAKTISTDRWVGIRRLKTFKCLPVVSSTQNNVQTKLYYTEAYTTNPLFVRCTIIPDLDPPYGVDTTILSSALASGYSSTQLMANMNGNLYYCPDLVSGSYEASNSPQYTQAVQLTAVMHQWDTSCNYLLPLQPSKITDRGLVIFSMQNAAGNSSLEAVITPTQADLTFDLVYLPFANIVNTTLAFTAAKENLLIESGDRMICITSIVDPSGLVIDVTHTYYDIDNSSSLSSTCISPTVSKKIEGNDTYTYASYLTINSSNCPFFAISNLRGHLVCKASMTQQYSAFIQEQLSNTVPFRTPTKATTNPSASSTEFLGAMGELLGIPMGMLLNFFLENPLMFLLGLLVIAVMIVIMLAFSKVIEAISKAGGNDGGDDD